MATTVTHPSTERETPREPERPNSGGGGRGTPPHGGGRGGGGGGGGPRRGLDYVHLYKMAVWIAMGGIVMFFSAMTSAMVVRSGMGEDWESFELPGVLWFSTAALLAGSFTLEMARRNLGPDSDAGLRRWVSLTAALGGAFLAGQLAGWRALADRGVYLASNPSSSFFYLFTAAHGLHLAGGVAALTYVLFRVWRTTAWPRRRAVVEATTLYWHFMDGLWVYLFVLLLVWR